MAGRPKKAPREKDLTSRYFSGGYDEDRIDQVEQFKGRNKSLQSDKMAKTADLRADGQGAIDIDALPVGEVIQVFSLYSEVAYEGKTYLCVVRRTLSKLAETFLVVGDLVKFRDLTVRDAAGNAAGTTAAAPDAPPQGVIEQILPRRTVLTRSDSFKGTTQHPIIANAEQVLIVASVRQPYAKWGLIDRMLIAAQAGGLKPIVCLNKVDLAVPDEDGNPPDDLVEARAVLAHYATLGVVVLETSVEGGIGIEELRAILVGRVTVLAGHSGVGKSSLVRAVEPSLILRVGEVSRYTDKGRHTTTSARRYPLAGREGGAVVDTPGVKQFGLWGVTRDNLDTFFPDVAAAKAAEEAATAGREEREGGEAAGAGAETPTVPEWRRQSYERIAESLPA